MPGRILGLLLALAAGTASAEELRTGDIVLLGTDSAWGFVARRFADGDSRWSHAGMVIREGERIAVVHMDGSPTGGMIRRETVSAFTGEARYVRVLRPELDPGQRARVGDWLLDHLARNTAFDTHFRLDDDPAMYCSELIWRALDEVAMTPGETSLPRIAGRSYVPVDRLLDLGRPVDGPEAAVAVVRRH
ncbi:MAG: YiiX/YebB-like N1pC/P60 family cysteine hydrolase [Pseudomonadota bacterium]